MNPADRVAKAEHLVKKPIWGCQMCGQCVLHDTGMTCPMTCPKTLRNGPCGGVRANGHCEVKPEMRCVWVKAYERSERLPLWRGHIDNVRPPVDNRLKGSSAWINLFSGRDKRTPAAWSPDAGAADAGADSPCGHGPGARAYADSPGGHGPGARAYADSPGGLARMPAAPPSNNGHGPDVRA